MFARGLWFLLFMHVSFEQAAAQSHMQLTLPISGRGMRVSSGDADWDHGSNDWKTIPPGTSIVAANLTGPGLITHIWMTFANQSGAYQNGDPRRLWLKCYWDDETTPSVDTPVGDFFAMGNGKVAALDSAVAQIGGKGAPRAYNSYWAMPFHHKARIVIENHSTTETFSKAYYHIDWMQLSSMPDNTLYFHARFRMARPLRAGSDFTVADVQGSGHYAGTVFSYIETPGAVWGEGDERIFIDGENEPSIAGTGMEDYFGEAWGFHPHSSHYHGYTQFPDGATMYRWHVMDPIPFQRSFRMTFENWGSTDGELPFEEKTWIEWSAVGFWYQQPIIANQVGAQTWRTLF